MKSFQSKITIMNKDYDLECIFHEHTTEIISKTPEYKERDSGWSLIKLIPLEMNVNHYTSMAGSFIPLCISSASYGGPVKTGKTFLIGSRR